MITVLAFGTFDLFHKGHEFFLQEAKKHGDRLVVVVARDVNVKHLKGRAPEQNEQLRLQAVRDFSAVDDARLGYEEWGMHLQVLDDVQPDVVCLGYDQRATLPEGAWRVVRIEAFEPERYKSSLLRKN